MTASSHFNWYELTTADPAAAAAFYSKVVGWKVESAGASSSGAAYRIFRTPEGGVAGLLEPPPEARGAAPFWSGYVTVDDVDEYARRFEAEGGAVHRPPAEIPGIGRFAVVADPQGAMLVLFRPIPPPDGSGPPALKGPGYPAWRELMAKDGPSAVDFYTRMFGWERSTGHDMGEMSVYQLIAYDGADRAGIMTAPPHIPMPHWDFYFGVDSAKAAAARVTEAGGAVVNGPMQVPTGDWVLQARDPQGAHFGLHSPDA